MVWNKLYAGLNAGGAEALVSVTAWLSRRGWIRTPDQQAAMVLGEGSLRFRVQRGWCKADLAAHPVNNCHELAFDKRQRLFLLTDHPRNNILIFDRNGQPLDSWTLNMRSAHGLTRVCDGASEYLWICDPYSSTVVKTTLDGRVVQRLPDPRTLGLYTPRMPYFPTQAAVAPNGDVYVADGYGSQYVLQFDANGRYVRHFGGKGRGDTQFDFAHGIAIDDRLPSRPTLLVTSRRESCLKRFSLEGEFIGRIELPGGFPCRPVVNRGLLWIGLCWSGAHLRPNSGFVVALDGDDRVCATLGGHAQRDERGELKALVSDYTCFHHVHDVAIDDDGHLYVAQWNAQRRFPLKLERC